MGDETRADEEPPRNEAELEAARDLLRAHRDRAERLLNAVRAGVLTLLAIAAIAYAPSLTPALNTVNVLVLVPTLLWTGAQYALWYRRPLLPSWLAGANPAVDITAVSAIVGGYALAQSPSLALKSPIFLAYFVILAGLSISASARRAAAVATLAVTEYALLLVVFVAGGHLTVLASPLIASGAPAVSILDEAAKLLLLSVAGAVATYASDWHERVVASYSRASRDREQLEGRLAKARLESLKLQLHPHFLFNTLNTITALIRPDPDGAERMVSGLSELLRLSLGSAGEQEVPLARELELLEHYVAIQQVRFQDRLTVAMRVDPGARDALVPNIVLQPLVENALRHGISPRAGPGRVEVEATRVDGMLRLRVADDGVGVRPPAARREGVGLGNTRERLLSLYGDRHRFEAGGRADGGFEVTIDLPFRTASGKGGGR